MEVIIAKTAGFCMGVDMALHKLDKAVTSPPRGGAIRTLGPIIHNPQVLEWYRNRGVLEIDEGRPLRPGDVVVIRAHGIPRQTQGQFEAQGIRLIDATCPKVKKAQVLIHRQAKQGKHLLLFGERDHPEVAGLVSYAPMHTVFENLDELIAQGIDPNRAYFLAAQTTQDREAFNAIRKYVLTQVDANMTILDTICTATKERQEEVRALSRQVQALVVVGGRNSGNTRRLAQIGQEAGIFVVHVETAEELPLHALTGHDRIGLTAGASTPSWIIASVAEALRQRNKT